MAQHDMNIANQGFPATRADLNNALQALASNNSGTSAPSTTFANQWWYDTQNNKLYIRNEANNAWIQVAVLDQTNNEWQITTGVVQAKDSDGLALKTDDGTTRLFIKDSDGAIGIGTSSPPVPLSAHGTGPQLNLYHNSTGNLGANFNYNGTTGNLSFATNGVNASSAPQMTLDLNGQLGIGTAVPLRQLSISNSTNAEMSFISGTSSNASILFGDGLTGADVYRGYIQYNHANNGMTFATNAVEGMTLKDGGNLEKLGDTNSARIIPQSDNAGFLGENSHRWEALFAVNGTIQTSDKTMKTEITNSALGLDFVKALRPVSYKWISGGKHFEYDEDDLTKSNPTITDVAGKRNHYGLIAQEVKEVLGDTDFGGWVSEDVTDENATQSLRYGQFIAPLIKAVQELSAEVETLKTKVAALEG